MSNLVEHARRELSLVENGPDGDREFADSLLRAVEGFDTYDGHSGGSHAVAVEWLSRLLRFENIAPLTDSPDEWMHVAGDVWGDPAGEGVWQNRRCSEAFSNDGGKTYYLLSEGGIDKNRAPLHTSVPSAQEPPAAG
jgi:hypothetical protein